MKLRCLNDKCGKDVMKHTLAYLHHEGRIVITVRRIKKRTHQNTLLFSPNGPTGSHSRTLSTLMSSAQSYMEAAGLGLGSGGDMPETPFATSQEPASPATNAWAHTDKSQSASNLSVRHPLDHPTDIMMWSRCKLCARRVTPYMPMSDPTYKMSFGKYLDLTFHQQTAICRTGSCPHSLHQHHVRFLGYAGMMASFEYDPFPSFQMVTVPKIPPVMRDTALLAKYQADLKQLSTVSYAVFQEFIVRIAEIDGLLDSDTQRTQLRRLTKKVCLERDRYTTYIQQIGLGPTKKPTRGESSTVEAADAAAAVAGGDSSQVDASGVSVNGVAIPAPAVVANGVSEVAYDSMDIYRLQRRLLLNYHSWNNRLSDMSLAFFPTVPKQGSISHSQSAIVGKSWWNLSKDGPQTTLPPAALTEGARGAATSKDNTTTPLSAMEHAVPSPNASPRSSMHENLATSASTNVQTSLGVASHSEPPSMQILPASNPSFGDVHSPLPAPHTPAPLASPEPASVSALSSSASSTLQLPSSSPSQGRLTPSVSFAGSLPTTQAPAKKTEFCS